MKKTGYKAAPPRALATTEARRPAARLNRRVDDRTKELRATQAEMEAFAYSISHDLRAPLIHIGGFVELLANHLDKQLDEKARHYLQTITASTYRVGRMIDDVLEFSRLNRLEMHFVPIYLETLVKEVIDELRPLAGDRHIVWLLGHLPTVEADPTLLRQAILNLAANAVKFTAPREDARIHVGTQRGDGETIFSIRDNGVGFDMKYREKLFGMFQRLHSAAEFDGNGVGLAHVARIIQRHGGRTWAEGVPGGGATFYFCLPDVRADLS